MSKEDKHQHVWVDGKCIWKDEGGELGCAFEKMTWAEAGRRKAIWNKYYDDVKGTEAYSLYRTQKAAFKDKNFELVKKIAERQKEKRLNQEWELTKPSFTDPALLEADRKLIIIS